MLTAGESRGEVRQGKHSYSPGTRGQMAQNPTGRSKGSARKEGATFLHRGLFLVLELILIEEYIKKKESCTIVPPKGEGRNRKCISKYNQKVALEN